MPIFQRYTFMKKHTLSQSRGRLPLMRLLRPVFSSSLPPLPFFFSTILASFARSTRFYDPLTVQIIISPPLSSRILYSGYAKRKASRHYRNTLPLKIACRPQGDFRRRCAYTIPFFTFCILLASFRKARIRSWQRQLAPILIFQTWIIFKTNILKEISKP